MQRFDEDPHSGDEVAAQITRGFIGHQGGLAIQKHIGEEIFDRWPMPIDGGPADTGFLGDSKMGDTTTLAAGTRTIVDAMVEHGVDRLVVLSAAGVDDSWQQIPWSSRLLFRTMLRNVFADHHAQEAIVKQSPLDWTIVRAAVLKDDPATGSYTLTNTAKTTKINRADVAACLVDQLDDPVNTRQALSVTTAA